MIVRPSQATDGYYGILGGSSAFYQRENGPGTALEVKCLALLVLSYDRNVPLRKRWMESVLDDAEHSKTVGDGEWHVPKSWSKTRTSVPTTFQHMLSGLSAERVRVARQDVPRRKQQERADVAEVLDAERAADRAADEAECKRAAKAMVAAADAFETVPVVADSALATTSDDAIVQAVDDALTGKSGNQKHDYLKAQLERIVRGQGHGQFKPPSYTSSKNVQINAKGTQTNVAYLRHALISALTAQKTQELPLTAATPQATARSSTVFTIGPPTAQRIALDALDVFEKDLLLDEVRRIREARASRAAAAADAATARRRPAPPPITSALEGRRVAVCVGFEDGFYWCRGTIGDVSDAQTCHPSGRKVGINRIYVCYDEFEEGFENLEAAWLDVSRVTYFMADDKEGAWQFLDDDDDEIEALDDPAPEDRAAMDSGDDDDGDDDDMDEDDD